MVASQISDFYRKERTTKLIASEGFTEMAIVDYLRIRFPPPPRIYIVAQDLHGGTPHCIITNACKYSQNRDYYKKYIYIDLDKKISKEDVSHAVNSGFEFIYNQKCGESTILQILKPNINWPNATTEYCRTQFKNIVGSISTLSDHLDNISDSVFKNNATTQQIIRIIQKI